MKAIIILLSILVLISLSNAFVYETEDKGIADSKDTNINHPKEATKLKFSTPKGAVGDFKFEVMTATSVLLCVQEKIQITAGLTSCNPDGFFYFKVDPPKTNSTHKFHSRMEDPPLKQFNATRYLRLERDFWVTYQIVDLTANFTNWELKIKITAPECDEGANKWGPLCDDSQYHYIKLGDQKDEKLEAGQTKYYILQTDKTQEIPKLQFAVSNTVHNFTVRYKRGGFPTETSRDVEASQDSNNTVVELNYIQKSENYHIFSLYNQAKEVQSVKINATNVTTQTPEVTEILADELLKDAAKNTVDTKKTKSTDGEIAFFSYKKSGTTNDLIVGVAGDGDETPNVYINTDGFPSPASYLLSNTNVTEPVHLFTATADPKTPTFNWYTFNTDGEAKNYTWMIGIVSNNDYTIFVGECARNCSEKGVCNKGTGVCFCDDGREGYDCGDRSFPILYIILIAIGSAIALAIAIAIPVTCYMKNRRNAGYERV